MNFIVGIALLCIGTFTLFSFGKSIKMKTWHLSGDYNLLTFGIAMFTLGIYSAVVL